MEKDSFETMLRNKVLQAESTLNLNTNKEGVWKSIQNKQQTQRKWYYMAVAMLFIIVIGTMLYHKEDKGSISVARLNIKKKVTTNTAKVQIEQQNSSIEQGGKAKKLESNKMELAKSAENVQSAEQLNTPKEVLVVVLPKADDETASMVPNKPVENRVMPITAVSTVPEFTVQFKKGAVIANNADEGLIITTLKKFKLKRDTTYFANAVEKQPTKIKLSFKREN